MFGFGDRANSMSDKRAGYTEIVRPTSGKAHRFETLRAGDFFTYEGRLYLKINLVDSVEIPHGTEPQIGTNQFSASCPVFAERVEIRIK